MSDQVTTTGAIRSYLAGLMKDLRDGKVSVEEARETVKIANQISKSLAVEADAMRVQLLANQEVTELGKMLITAGED